MTLTRKHAWMVRGRARWTGVVLGVLALVGGWGTFAHADLAEENLVERVKGAVVYIQHEKAGGTGFLISADGYIFTNSHVVGAQSQTDPSKTAERIIVVLDDGSKYPAKVIGWSWTWQPDCALIKIDCPKPLPFFKLGDSTSLRVGQKVFAIGQPKFLKKTVTKGILSNTRRVAGDMIMPVLQMDSEINPGNSGGPLINEQGEVVGINTYGFGGPGLGGAFPINVLKDVEPHFRQYGRFKKTWIDLIDIEEVSIVSREAWGMKGGVQVSKVLAGSAADRAGLKAGDIIVALDGKPLKGTDEPLADALEFNWSIMVKPPKGQVALTVSRSGTTGRVTQVINVPLSEAPLSLAELPMVPIHELNANFKKWTPWLAFQYKKAANGGAVVATVGAGGVFQKAGVQPNDVVVNVESVPVDTLEACEQEFHRHMAAGKKLIRFKILRKQGFVDLVAAPDYALKDKKVALVMAATNVHEGYRKKIKHHFERVGAVVSELTSASGAWEPGAFDGFVFLDGAARDGALDFLPVDRLEAIIKTEHPVGAIGGAPAALVNAVPALGSRKVTFRSGWLSKMKTPPNYTGVEVERDGWWISWTGEDEETYFEKFTSELDQQIGAGSSKP